MIQPAQILNLACNHCGAALHVKSGTQYVTCGYCGSQLMVHEEGGSLYTEVLNRIETKATNIEKGVEIIKLQNELERLDREYQNEKLEEKIEDTQKNKNADSSSPIGAIIGGVVAIFIILVILTTIFGNNGPFHSAPSNGGISFQSSSPGIESFFPCIVILAVLAIIGGIVFSVIKGMDESTAKDQRESEYHRRRRELLDAIEKQNQQG